VGNEVLVGFFAQGSHRLVPVAICPVAHPAICNLLAPLRDFLQGFPPARGFVPQVDLQIDGHDRPWAVLHLLRPLTGEQKRDLRAFFGANGAAGVHLQAGRKQTLAPLAGETVPPRMPFTVTAGDRELALDVTPGGFVQANPAVNQKLVDELVVLTPGYVGRPALDLYCGAGNFTLPLAVRASEVAGIEDYPPAARDAGANAGRNGLPRVRVLGEPARPGLATLAAEGFRPDFALLDPPREGAAEVVGPLADLAPEQILYVSCAPPTLARDLKAFTGRGYRIEWTRIADMFPQTAHVESLTLLRSPRA
jgi:23S rRNA (uracil1939-C5)-methyltransferase